MKKRSLFMKRIFLDICRSYNTSGLLQRHNSALIPRPLSISRSYSHNCIEECDDKELQLNDMNYPLSDNQVDLYDGILRQGEIFQTSNKFHSLSLSEHGSLIQIDDENSMRYMNKLKRINLDMASVYGEEEELNLNLQILGSFDKEQGANFKNSHKNSIKSAICKNPNESKNMRLLIKNHDYKINSSSVEEFFGRHITEKLKYYDWELLQFPQDIESRNLKQYFQRINLVDFKYDCNGYEKIVFSQMYGLTKNICKLEGIVDLEMMHEFITFFSNYAAIKTIFNTINSFEKIGIFPNRETLHLLIYNLNKIPDYTIRKDLLNLYITMGIKKWKISTDLTTKLLICHIEKSSKKRFSIGRALINEGIDYKYLKWIQCEDSINIDLDKGHKTIFENIITLLIKRNIIEDTDSDRNKAFQIYIRSLTNKNRIKIAIDELTNNSQYESSAGWNYIIEKLLKRNEIWKCFAVINLIKYNDNVDKMDIYLPILKNHKRIFEFFTKQNFEKHIAENVYRVIMNKIHTLSGFQGKLKTMKNMSMENISTQDVEDIECKLMKIQLWGDDKTGFENFLPLTLHNKNYIDVKLLWRVLDLERERVPLGLLCVDPITFPNL